jgi:hypothetical protein
MRTPAQLAAPILALALGSMLAFGPGCGGDDDDSGGGGEPAIAVPEVGTTWSIDATSGQVVSPEGADGIFNVVASDFPFFAGVHATGVASLDLLLAISADGGSGQEMCNRTVVMPGVAVDAEGRFTFGPTDFTIGNGIKTLGMSLSGKIAEDRSTISEVALQGSVILATIPDGMLTVASAEICPTLALADIECSTCSDGSGECLDAHITGLHGRRAIEVVLTEIAQSDCHAQCAESAANADCTP